MTPHIGDAQIRIGTSLGLAHVIVATFLRSTAISGLLMADQFDRR